MKKAIKKAISLTLATLCVSSTMLTAYASEPYDSYSYDFWDDPVPAQAAYKVNDTYTGKNLGLERLTDPKDELFISKNISTSLSGAKDIFYEETLEEFWVADTQNSRILRLNKDLQLIGCYTGVDSSESGKASFNAPAGMFVKVEENGDVILYVGDTQNSRILKCKIVDGLHCECLLEIGKPDSAIYSSKSNTFLPEKILVDGADNIYAVCTSLNAGSAQFNYKGEFQGFYGANRVEVTAEIIRRQVWRIFASDEQLKSMESAAPTEYKNFDIDAEGFIYTCTEAANTTTDAVKKLNAAGYNIWNNDAGNEYHFGDIVTGSTYDAATNTNYTTRLTDLDIDKDGFINILDYSTGRVFVYDEFCSLVTIFGTKNNNSDQKGSFNAPNAVETAYGNVYVVDGSKNDITVYSTTLYGSYLKQAVLLYDDGSYEDAEPYWQEVLDRNGTCSFALLGLGKAALNKGEYKLAMEYFEDCYAQRSYDRAFKYYREQWLQDNFILVFVVIVALLIFIAVFSTLKKKGIIKKRVRKVKKAAPERKKTKKELEHEAQIAAELEAQKAAELEAQKAEASEAAEAQEAEKEEE